MVAEIDFRAEREKLGVDQGELAARAELSQSFLCDIERGRRVPRKAILMRLCEALLDLGSERLQGVGETQLTIRRFLAALKRGGTSAAIARKSLPKIRAACKKFGIKISQTVTAGDAASQAPQTVVKIKRIKAARKRKSVAGKTRTGD